MTICHNPECNQPHDRHGLTFSTVYRWGNPEQPYYYAVIQ